MEILISGNLGSLAADAFSDLTKSHKVVIAAKGIKPAQVKGHLAAFQHGPLDHFFPEVFRLYDLGAVIFFATRGEQRSSVADGSPESFGSVLSLCARHNVRRVICVSSTEVCANTAGADESDLVNPRNQAGILLESVEKMCEMYRRQAGLQISIVRVPYVYHDQSADSMFGRAVLQASQNKTVELPGAEGQACDFLHAGDLATLLARLIDSDSAEDPHLLHAGSGKARTFLDFARLVEDRFPGCDIRFAADPYGVPPPALTALARQQVDWVALNELEHEFTGIADSIVKTSPAKPSVWSRIKAVLVNRTWIIQLLEILLSFILMEYLITVTGDSLQFKFIDIRLLFVMIIGIIHGLRSGLLAALLACLSIIFAYVSVHVDWRAVIYNVDSWLPFAAYLLAGAVTGYIRDKGDSALAFEKQKTAAQEKHYAFLYDLYNQTMAHKDQYKSQLIGYRDSFGRVYEITRRLDHMVPDAVFGQAIQILEDTMGNAAVAVYTLDQSMAYARLAVSSSALAEKLGRSIRISEYGELFGNLEKGKVWINRQMLDNYPFYCVPIYRGDVLYAVVMAFNVPYEQMSASGSNQFLVVCGLIQAALIRAISYNEATELQSCIAGTHILTAPVFAELLSVRREMRRLKLADHTLLRVEDPVDNLARLSELAEQGVRRTDIIGQGADGCIYILLAQAQPDSSAAALKRLETMGVRCVPAEVTVGSEHGEESGDVA